MLVVPQKNSVLPVATTVKHSDEPNEDFQVKVPIQGVLFNGQYCFDVVLTTDLNRITGPLRGDPKHPQALVKHREIMLTLLKDLTTVDLCFSFPSDKSCSNFGLWAHQTILKRYKPLAEFINSPPAKESKERKIVRFKGDKSRDSSRSSDSYSGESDEGDESEYEEDDDRCCLLIDDEFMMATICALLMYVYTGDIELSVDTSKFAIKQSEGDGSTSGQGKNSTRHPLGLDSGWRFKDVTWMDLLKAADYYGVTDLQARCEEEVIASINESNALDILFNVGQKYKDIKLEAIDYIANMMGSLFNQERDPFAPYKDHPSCYELMVEVMRHKGNQGL
ncbi:hypothetical protein BCR41DRAFT_372977 [Lobosporangium transversale]|uniref:BTB domain-containing protein n=1 Tax=Lobosporangium transversale TaxID=64571 RepID=A0A1Y2GF57_9FUNG|nr:hypothetical protein BCR41DRAFT_372977 [Lobosporangium transversale]ORZ09067.1 hypothetical protein BCR41DRAFT_372977 [Lobosporangium transversale]|eukprot:XP_021878694.1 hypothetical protein BCR41DRAFT_372977 [Lobosporangium transversale]